MQINAKQCIELRKIILLIVQNGESNMKKERSIDKFVKTRYIEYRQTRWDATVMQNITQMKQTIA